MMMALYRQIATLGPIGYLYAPGTVASCLTLVFIHLFRLHTRDPFIYALTTLIVAIIGFFAVRRVLAGARMHDDPAEIVIDEVVGCMVTFFMVPLTMQWAMLGLVLFRFFDIFKIGGIHRLERFVSAWGVMLDDIAAGIISNVIIQLARHYAQ